MTSVTKELFDKLGFIKEIIDRLMLLAGIVGGGGLHGESIMLSQPYKYRKNKKGCLMDSYDIFEPITFRKDLTNYAINRNGEIKNVSNNRILSGSKGFGYKTVILTTDNGEKISIRNHVAVARQFLPNPCNKPIVNHKDENKNNPCIDNLEWVSHKENSNYGTCSHRASESRRKAINQYSISGKYIRTWKDAESIVTYIKMFGVRKNENTIWSACKGNQSYTLGYAWRFYEGNRNNIRLSKLKKMELAYLQKAPVRIISENTDVPSEYIYKPADKEYVLQYFMDSERLTRNEKIMLLEAVK